MIGPLETRALAHPEGNRIDLEWVYPDPEIDPDRRGYPGMRIVRRQGTYPTEATDGDLVAEALDLPFTLDRQGQRLYRVTDTGLAGETVFYYMFFPFADGPGQPAYHADVRHRAAAMATAPYDHAGRMSALLPAIYGRYDDETARQMPAELVRKLVPEDREKGPLRRLLELTGSHLDQLHSLARAALGLYDPERVDGRLLPLLASWIGWPMDHRIELRDQRSEIRKAPYIYRTVGLIPTVEATVKRILGRESRTKELAYNVLLSNRPPRLNLWLARRKAGTWTPPTEPLSLHGACEGRPAAVYDGDGQLWLFFHTRRKRSKVTWSAGQGPDGKPSSYRRRGQWDIWYKTLAADGDWTESQPLTERPAIDQHPSAAFQDPTLWVFWDTWSESDPAWRLCYRTRQQGNWSPRQALWHDDGVERRRPQAVVAGQEQLWLFWQERVDGGWQVRYNRHDGSGWERPSPASLRGPSLADPQVAEIDPRTEEDLFVVVDKVPRLWVFWARRERGAGGRWRVAYRVKPDLDLAAWNWGEVLELPAEPGASDREPAVAVDTAGSLELFWSSNHQGSWSMWHTPLPLTPDSQPARKITGGPFAQRAPLAVPAARSTDTLLFYGSNANLTYASHFYGVTRTVDGRYGGGTAADARNVVKNALRASYDDFQSYTFDAGVRGQRGEKNWYAHDTLGLYLTLREDPAFKAREQNVIETVLRQFLPVQIRAVAIPEAFTVPIFSWSEETPGHRSVDFTVDPVDTSQRTWDTGPEPEGVRPVAFPHRIFSWSEQTPGHRSVDFTVDSVDTSQRTWDVGPEQSETV